MMNIQSRTENTWTFNSEENKSKTHEISRSTNLEFPIVATLTIAEKVKKITEMVYMP